MSEWAPERHAAVKQRCDAATPGPWEADHRHTGYGPHDDESSGLGLEIHGPPEASGRGQFARAADAQFIAHARTDLPDALDAIRHLQMKLSVVRSAALAVIQADADEPKRLTAAIGALHFAVIGTASDAWVCVCPEHWRRIGNGSGGWECPLHGACYSGPREDPA